MTLIIGIKCTDGIVLGADGAATFSTMGQQTIRQPIKKKLTILDDCVVVGISGPVGLGQRLCGEIQKLWKEKALSGKQPYQAMTIIRKSLWQHMADEYQAAEAARKVIGPVALDSALASTIIALPISKAMCLFQFDQQGAPEEATTDLPFVAMGSGRNTADPFLAFIRRIFWKDTIPNLAEGIFATLWTLDHAIKTSPGGIAEPIQIVVLKTNGSDCKAQELNETDLQEHYEAIGAAEKSLANFKNSEIPIKEPPQP